MGISDDIHPKHKRKNNPADLRDDDFEDIVEPDHKEKDNHQQSEQKPENHDSPLKNEFFATGTKTKGYSAKHKVFLFVLVVVVIAMIALAAWQNLDLIKRRVFKISSPDIKTTTTNEINKQSSKLETTTESTEQPVTTQTPVEQPVQTTTTPAPPDKTSFKIRVSNGNGITGSAQKVVNSLRGAGFTVSSVGNAASFNYKTTIVYYQTGKEAEANLVKDALAERSVSTQESKTLKTYPVLVVVGAK